MVNKGKWVVVICTTKTYLLDENNVMFGEVVQVMNVVKAMENVWLPHGTSIMPVTIVACGQVNFDDPPEDDDEEP